MTVGKILAAVHTPPPPSGSFVAVQEFNVVAVMDRFEVRSCFNRGAALSPSLIAQREIA